ncbi:MAG: class I SAM-dependent RNA methyltransferase, partial [Deltaproteobacteria bacterium]|nr:class I SAM-dependent RNA methyltransferase [Deltaproteobacteria bacterium]
AGGLKLVFPAGVFSQANPFTAAKIYQKVGGLAGLTGKETVLDLYCGVGPISLSLAQIARLILGIDEHKPSIAAAKQNARRNGISNCRFFAGGTAETIERIQNDVRKPALIVMNPPRKGVQPSALTATLALDASKIIYVSCEPKSLARDLDRLLKAGYHLSGLQPFDMFPQTDQVETVALLE